MPNKNNTKLAKNTDCPEPPLETDIAEFSEVSMSDWFSPGLLIRTGLRKLASMLFASYADKRIVLAATRKAKQFTEEWKDRESIWIDYVADLGDGWDSTYSVASCLAQSELTIEGVEESLPRGDILVMGGDQVYPYASTEEYKNRLIKPYRAALPCSDETSAPSLFAIPGNHDWYDGLSGFMRHFGQQGWLGGWRTRQNRSYWAIQLPHGWWLWGIDSQLESYIDRAQLDYFRSTAEKHMVKGDRIILCVAEPSWIFASNGDSKMHRNLAFFENQVIKPAGGHLALTISGDLHHYSHYVETESDAGQARHKVTCGGGGAFTHGTHHLPENISLDETGTGGNYKCTESLSPSRNESKAMLWDNLLFPFKHPAFSLVLAGFYLVYAWVLNRTQLLPELSAIPFKLENVLQIPGAYAEATVTSLLATAFVALLVISGMMFAQPDWSSCPSRKPLHKWVAGIVHSVLHLVVLLGSLWFVATESWITIPPDPPYWGSALMFSLSIALAGAVLGGVVFGAYLLFSNLLFGFHRTEAFSALANKDHKSYLKIFINKDGASVYSTGLKKTVRDWKWNSPVTDGESWVVGADGNPECQLIEEVWKVE